MGNETPVIILTSYNWDDIADEAKAAGVDTFVAKPLFAEKVLDEFREAFKKKNAKLVRETTDLKGRRVLLAEDVSVNAFDEDVQHSMQAGLNAHLSKPVEPEILFETLKGLLHN